MKPQIFRTALVLIALAHALAEGSPGQETDPKSEPEIVWQERHGGELANVLRGYYTVMIHSDMTSSCRADRGEVCMNGDHEDQQWRSSTPREPERIERFARRIVEAALSRPDDALGFAQAVYAVSRLRPPEDALLLADDCSFVDWWCELLRGMVQQRAGRPERAERHFRAALAEADSALACRLTDVGELLDGPDSRAYRNLACSDRADFERRFWWLTDPLISRPGNDRWAEHIARRFELVLHERLLEAIGSEHPDVHEVAVVRRGHEDSWSDRPMGPMPFTRWTSIRAARYRFTPVSAVGDGVADLRYDLPADRNDEGYTPATYGPVFELPAQFARFREGNRLLLAAAADLNGLPLPLANTLLVLSEGPGGIPLQLGQAAGSRRPVFSVLVDPVTAIVGIESRARNNAVGRARGGLLPLAAEVLALSDVLLVTPDSLDLPAGRDEAVASMLGGTTIDSGTEMVVYWEIYGVASDRPVAISLAIDGGPAGWFTRVLRALRVRSDERGTVVSWTETATGPTHHAALSLDIGSLEDGTYDLRITVSDQDGAEATGTRRFHVDRN